MNWQVAGLSLEVAFDAGQGGLASEVRELWVHLEPGEEPLEADVKLRFSSRKDELAKGAKLLSPQHPAATYTFSGYVTRALIQEMLGDKILLHAAAVEMPSREVVVLVGASGAGKSTASIHLGREGKYLSDELAIIEPSTFEVIAYPKPVSQVIVGSKVKRDVSLDALGIEVAPSGRPPGMLVLLDRARGQHDKSSQAPVPSIERVPLAEALLVLVSQSSSLWRVPGGLAVLAEIANSTGGVLRARYQEVTELSSLLAKVPTAATESWVEVPGVGAEEVPSEGEYVVSPFQQALVLSEGVVVLSKLEAAYLPGIVGLVWDLLRVCGPLALEDVMSAVSADLGPHPDARRLVGSAIGRLLAGGWALTS